MERFQWVEVGQHFQLRHELLADRFTQPAVVFKATVNAKTNFDLVAERIKMHVRRAVQDCAAEQIDGLWVHDASDNGHNG